MRFINITTGKVSLLLFGSGMCALVYQMAWLREFRLIFGASTAASAAVLAIFMGGLGVGGLVLGRRVDRHDRPLGFYANLELLIAATAAATPVALWAVRQAYIASGGSLTMGLWGATLARLVLAALVLAVPTFLMGGTLPAAARSVESDDDAGRRNLAFLYGANTLGAVTGSAVATFFLIEVFGTHKTLWAACGINALIGLAARSLSAASLQEGEDEEEEIAAEQSVPDKPRKVAEAKAATPDAEPDVAAPSEGPNAPPGFVLIASAVVGFAFLLMELVWYRMLSPILGGSTYTFGLILAVALLGIGLGGAAYAVLRVNRPATLTGFALTCATEALFIAIPFALGDRLALQAMLLRSLASMGFWGLVLGWTIITLVVVLPAAFIAGVQFPLLIALLGRGREGVGRHIGLAYAYNTAGAILGSLGGGFGLLPLLTAVNVWRAVVVVLALLAVATLAVAALARAAGLADDEAAARFGGRGRRGTSASADGPTPLFAPEFLNRLAAPAVAALLALLLLLPLGPTAAWRHGGIGAGRSDHFDVGPNFLHKFVNEQRRGIVQEWDGVESSVALSDGGGYTFIVNGKADGHARRDAGTQVMGGLVGAIVHKDVRCAMVIGLGTGSTAGWLGAVPDVERVDVMELEPAILQVARYCAEANQNVMSNPKVHVTIGDAREALLASRSTYDLIFSEPSNPYRAGIASLYTREFYAACAKRLNAGGLFLQWVQGYEVDAQTIRTVYATLAAVFPAVETWRTQSGDLLLMASLEPIVFDVPRMRARIAGEPYRTALAKVWRVTDLEGVLAHHFANSDFARAVAAAEKGRVNTDDQNLVEFSFARSVGVHGGFELASILKLAEARGEERPVLTGGEVDWDGVEDQRVTSYINDNIIPPLPPQKTGEPRPLRDRRFRTAALAHVLRGSASTAAEMWKKQTRAPQNLTEYLFMAQCYAALASDDALPLIEKLRAVFPVEADCITAQLRRNQRRGLEAMEAMERSFVGYRSEPWARDEQMLQLLILAPELAGNEPTGNAALRLYAALDQPFALHALQDIRKIMLLHIGNHLDARKGTRKAAEAAAAFEPYVPWERDVLEARLNAYLRANHPLTMLAAEQLDEYREGEPFPFDLGLTPEPPATQPATGPTTGPGMLLGPRIGPGAASQPTAPNGDSEGPVMPADPARPMHTPPAGLGPSATPPAGAAGNQ